MLEKMLCRISGLLQVYLVHNLVDVRHALRDKGQDVVENEEKCGKTASITMGMRTEGSIKDNIKMETEEKQEDNVRKMLIESE